MNSPCQQLDDFLSGTLDKGQSLEFTRHLACCDTCRETVEFTNMLDTSIQAAWNRVKAPAREWPSVNSVSEFTGNQIPELNRENRRLSPLSILVMVASLLLVIGIGWSIQNFQANPRDTLSAKHNLPKSKDDDSSRTANAQIEEEKSTDAVFEPVEFFVGPYPTQAILVPQVSTPEFTIIRAFPALTNQDISISKKE